MSELPSWGSVGVWLSKLSLVGAAEAVSVARCIEECGYGSLWIGETTTGKEVLTHAGLLLAGTEQLVIGTGIASVWARDAVAAHAGAVTLGEAYPGRFVLGLSVSHRQLAEVRGHRYDRPLAAMRGYLDEMAAARCDAPAGPVPVPVVLAALGPKMTTLAIERTTGVHTYFMPVDHTRRSRQLMGATSALLPEQAFVVDANPVRARSIAREHMAFYLGQPNYLRALADLGFGAGDVARGGQPTSRCTRGLGRTRPCCSADHRTTQRRRRPCAGAAARRSRQRRGPADGGGRSPSASHHHCLTQPPTVVGQAP